MKGTEVSKELSFGLNRAFLQIIIPETGLYQICAWGNDLVVPFTACPCPASHLLLGQDFLHGLGGPLQRELSLLPSAR